MSKEYKKGLVSICCLGYKHKDFLTDCIESIWEQDYKNIEIIAMDDGSKDGSDELLDELSKKSPFPMKVLKQENTGNVGFNVNKLINLASGEFIMFSSLDDFFTNTSISDKIYDMQKDECIVFNAPLINYNIANGKSINRKTVKEELLLREKSPLIKLQSITVDDLIDVEYNNFGTFYIQGVLFRKKFIDNVGGFDDDMIGDDIVLRTKLFFHVKQNSLKFLFTDKIGIYYRMHDNNIHKNSYRQILTIAQWLDRYFPDKENPKIYKDWILHALYAYEKNYKDCYKYLEIPRLREYEKDILNVIKERKKEYKKNILKSIIGINNKYVDGYKIKYLTILFFKIQIKKTKNEK